MLVRLYENGYGRFNGRDYYLYIPEGYDKKTIIDYFMINCTFDYQFIEGTEVELENRFDGVKFFYDENVENVLVN